MAGSLNKVTLIGHLGKDVEMRFMPSGEAIANFSLATSEEWKDKATGDKKERTEWHRCTAFGRLGEIFGQYVKKGSQVYIEGKLQTRKWTDKENVDRYTTEIRVDQLVMLGKPDGSSAAGSPAGTSRPVQQQTRPTSGGGAFDDLDSDIPF